MIVQSKTGRGKLQEKLENDLTKQFFYDSLMMLTDNVRISLGGGGY